MNEQEIAMELAMKELNDIQFNAINKEKVKAPDM